MLPARFFYFCECCAVKVLIADEHDGFWDCAFCHNISTRISSAQPVRPRQIWGIGGYSLNKRRPFVRKRALLATNWLYDSGDILFYKKDIWEVKREMNDLVEENATIGDNAELKI